ncbi:MAG: PH domain-containing protein [Candidatus Brocadia sp.]|nr:PH domain-containing protein [Candidatus Brocadia sp.]
MSVKTIETDAKTLNKEPVFNKNTEIQILQSSKPSVRQHWLLFSISAVSILLAFTSFGTNTITGLCLLSISGLSIVYKMLSVCTTKYVITYQGVLVRKGSFSRKFKEIPYYDINNISIKQGRMQKRLRIGNLTISTKDVKSVWKGIKNPHKIKEVINKAKVSEYEKRTLLRKIL